MDINDIPNTLFQMWLEEFLKENSLDAFSKLKHYIIGSDPDPLIKYAYKEDVLVFRAAIGKSKEEGKGPIFNLLKKYHSRLNESHKQNNHLSCEI